MEKCGEVGRDLTWERKVPGGGLPHFTAVGPGLCSPHMERGPGPTPAPREHVCCDKTVYRPVNVRGAAQWFKAAGRGGWGVPGVPGAMWKT
ncbi:hypothetical protein GCM10007061_20610 [Kocuria marina]|nr:hypothetical protein GCM10007061_20610 [Kocuria marina]